MTLPPELHALEHQYSEVLKQLKAGELDPDTAGQYINNLTCLDAAGAWWTVLPSTRPPNTVFLRSHNGQPYSPSNPAMFTTKAGRTVKSKRHTGIVIALVVAAVVGIAFFILLGFFLTDLGFDLEDMGVPF